MGEDAPPDRGPGNVGPERGVRSAAPEPSCRDVAPDRGYRIAHFTDVHVTEAPSRIPWRALLSKRLLGWINLALLGRIDHFAGIEEILRAFVEDVTATAPDAIVSTGDLTGLALPSEFEEARRLLSPLLGDIRVTGIPGNHDVYVRSAVRRRLYEGAFGAWTRTDFAPEDFPREHRASYPYPLVRLLGQDAALIALRDVRPNAPHDSSGIVGREQLVALEGLLVHPRVAPRTRIVAFHCGFLRAGGRRDRPWHRLRDWRRLVEVCAAGGAKLLIHGHTHARFVERPGPLTPVAVANPGSLTSLHHEKAYHVYVVRGGGAATEVEVEVRRYDPERKAFAAWPGAPGAGPLEVTSTTRPASGPSDARGAAR